MVKYRLLALVVTAWLTHVLVAPCWALTIVYPADKTYVSRSDYLIVKGGDAPPLDAYIVDINGIASDPIDVSAPDYRQAFGDMLILEPEWSVGENRLVVRGFAAGKEVVRREAKIFYINGRTVVPPGGYAPYVMHTPEREALCVPCHNMRPDKIQLGSEDAAINPCAACHKKLIDRKYVHGPAGVWGCVNCHNGDSTPSRWQVAGEVGKLCTDCHADKVEEYNKNKYVHGPVGVGMCTLCHDPHASPHPAQLIDAVNPLCGGCHPTVREGQHVVRGIAGKGHPLQGMATSQRPAGIDCASCHNPHSGASSRFFVGNAKSNMELCQVCHKK